MMPVSSRSASTRWFSYVSATMPSASARMRRFVSIVTKMVGRPPSCSRTSNAVCRIAWSIAAWSIALGSSGRLRRHGDAQRAARLERHALRERAALLAEIVEQARDGARVAAALGAFALELVDLLDDVDRDDDVVVLEPEDGVRVVEQDVRVEDVVLLQGEAVFTVGEERGQGAMKSVGAFERALEVMRAVRLIGAVTPTNADSERARLEAAYERGDAVMPRWEYARRDVSALGVELAELTRAARDWEEPLRSLYSARIEEMGLEVAIVGAVGAVGLGGLAARRYRVSARAKRAADAMVASFAVVCAAGQRVGASDVAGDSVVASDDERDPRSLVCQVRAAIGALRAPFAVRIASGLGALAATGERTVYVARGRSLCERAARRIALHEVHGHVLPRVRAAHAHPMFALGVARGADDQEGLALLYEERAELLDPERRAELARRHQAATLMRAGADFVEVTRSLSLTSTIPDAIAAASRVFRGSSGTSPGLGRESVYLTSFARVRAHLAKHPDDERALASGQVAVDAIAALRPLFARIIAPDNTRAPTHHRRSPPSDTRILADTDPPNSRTNKTPVPTSSRKPLYDSRPTDTASSPSTRPYTFRSAR